MPRTSTDGWIASLSAERAGVGRSSTAARVAGVLRRHVTDGRLLPGTRLSEEDIGAALGVSRNTLREAFRLLTHERLLVHEFNRGVFVRTLTVDDVHDLYRFRRLVECAAIRQSAGRPLDDVRRAVEEGESAASRGDWAGVGTANMHFHQGLVGLAGSDRLSEAAQHVLAEQRLVFHVMSGPREFHESYLAENRQILAQLQAGRPDEAAAALLRYFHIAEKQLTDAFLAGA